MVEEECTFAKTASLMSAPHVSPSPPPPLHPHLSPACSAFWHWRPILVLICSSPSLQCVFPQRASLPSTQPVAPIRTVTGTVSAALVMRFGYRVPNRTQVVAAFPTSANLCSVSIEVSLRLYGVAPLHIAPPYAYYTPPLPHLHSPVLLTFYCPSAHCVWLWVGLVPVRTVYPFFSPMFCQTVCYP